LHKNIGKRKENGDPGQDTPKISKKGGKFLEFLEEVGALSGGF